MEITNIDDSISASNQLIILSTENTAIYKNIDSNQVFENAIRNSINENNENIDTNLDTDDPCSTSKKKPSDLKLKLDNSEHTLTDPDPNAQNEITTATNSSTNQDSVVFKKAKKSKKSHFKVNQQNNQLNQSNSSSIDPNDSNAANNSSN